MFGPRDEHLLEALQYRPKNNLWNLWWIFMLKIWWNLFRENLNSFQFFCMGRGPELIFWKTVITRLGVLYARTKKITRLDLASVSSHKNINLYPFEYEDFLDYQIDTPFPEKIYLRELKESGQTISGEKALLFLRISEINLYLRSHRKPRQTARRFLICENIPSRELVVLGNFSSGYFW